MADGLTAREMPKLSGHSSSCAELASRRDQALARGSRLDESVPGSGLGLAIVVELAALYEGAVSLAPSGAGGLRVDLTLPMWRATGR